jgi:hypothetical protein
MGQCQMASGSGREAGDGQEKYSRAPATIYSPEMDACMYFIRWIKSKCATAIIGKTFMRHYWLQMMCFFPHPSGQKVNWHCKLKMSGFCASD